MNKEKILLFIKIPPPLTGATLMNKRVHESELLRANFNIHSILISYMSKRNEMGKWRVNKAYKTIIVLYKLIHELVLFKPRLIYFQLSPHGVAFLRDLFFVLIIKIFNVKIVYHMRGKGIKQKSKVKWKKIFYKFAFRNSDIICLSSLLTYDIEDVFNGTIHIVNNGIPDIANCFSTKSQENENYNVNILYLSNLKKSKGILDFIEAMNLLNQRGLKFNAMIVGEEADLLSNDINKLIFTKKLNERIIFDGPKFDNEKYQILAKSDIFVLPTKNECFPGVLLEAMQFQLPVITTHEGAIPEIVDSEITGILVDKNAPVQIAEKIEILINNPELRKSMGKAGRRKFKKNYILKRFEEKLNDVFYDILSKV